MTNNLKEEIDNILGSLAQESYMYGVNPEDFGKAPTIEEATEAILALINQKEKELLEKFEEAIEENDIANQVVAKALREGYELHFNDYVADLDVDKKIVYLSPKSAPLEPKEEINRCICSGAIPSHTKCRVEPTPPSQIEEEKVSAEMINKIETIAGYLKPLYNDLDVLKKMGAWHFMPGLIEEIEEWLQELNNTK